MKVDSKIVISIQSVFISIYTNVLFVKHLVLAIRTYFKMAKKPTSTFPVGHSLTDTLAESLILTTLGSQTYDFNCLF